MNDSSPICPRVLLALALLLTTFQASTPSAHANLTDSPRILRVSPDGSTTDATCGADWDHPCDLQYALKSLSQTGDAIWAKNGTYYPTADPSDRAATFQLRSGIALYGGFAGDETSVEGRDMVDHLWIQRSLLSGDIDQNDEPGLTNSFHVVTASGVDSSAVLDGFAIYGGYANGPTEVDNLGGGLTMVNGSPTLSNIFFLSNQALNGGGLYCEGGSPSLTNIIFNRNTARGAGGGLANEGGSLSLDHVVLFYNEAKYGGGMANDNGSAIIKNSSFFSNSATETGAGLHNANSSVTLENSTFFSNYGSSLGDGIYNDWSNVLLIHVTFFDNLSRNELTQTLLSNHSTVTMRNSILWSANPDQFFGTESQFIASYSDISQPVGVIFPGDGNINLNPHFINGSGGSLGEGGWFVITLKPLLPSPVINAVPLAFCLGADGNPLTQDARGLPRPFGLGCDMGAYEQQIQMNYLPLISQ